MMPMLPELPLREAFLERCVLSASGLRFIHSGDEEDSSTEVCDEASLFVLCALDAFLLEGKLKEGDVLWLGRDSRPTGEALLNLAESYLRGRGLIVKKVGLGPIPEVMAATHQRGAQGFVYFTASHNPKGHNGLKLGLADGAVLPKPKAAPLIEILRISYLDDKKAGFLWGKYLAEVKSSSDEIHKEDSLASYSSFSLSTVCPQDPNGFFEKLNKAWGEGEAPLFLIDMNGSSRLASVDIDFLKRAGLEVEVIGDEPGVFQHAIVPEGASLEPLRKKMQAYLDQGRRVFGGMVPDCDGDRGNLILPIGGIAVPLKAQETFALCVLAELATRRAQGESMKMALAVNGPTSLRIDRLLEAFDVEVHRAEVGEANVLGLAQELREKDFLVPLSGEGSNGGNILHPSTVRDPLMTLMSLLKFVGYPVKGDKTAAEIQLDCVKIDPCLALERVFKEMPSWLTTDAFEGEALMPVPPIDHETLKSGYEYALSHHFASEPKFWKNKGVTGLRFMSNDGLRNIQGPGGRPDGSKGGLQVFLEDESEKRLGFLWMRGSGTEPVFRVMVDWGGDEKDYKELLSLHRQLIETVVAT